MVIKSLSREYFLSDKLHASLYIDTIIWIHMSVYYQFYDYILNCNFQSTTRVYFIYKMRKSKNNVLKILNRDF